ncbi:MAG: AraC family transcriptional regulator [Lachnospiraceae bacterium]|nr:AraC family transcriptional regulator [Lachnospiraceae bacterium]
MDYKKELFYREFVQREDNFLRAPYNPEIEFYATIKAGDIKKLKELLKEELTDKPGLGRLSNNPLQNLKYHFVVTTALCARYCIQGGMDISTAYSLSDFYIQKADSCKKMSEITALHPVMCMDYATRMKDLRKNAICSRPIVECVKYIYDNLHSRITVDELADHVGLNQSYLSRLFKKEVGATISEYIRKQKIETAKNMLIFSEYKPADIASTLAFPSQSYFTEIFKKQTGYTPTEYRKQFFQSAL